MYTFQDINIGDTIITKDGTKGKVVQLKSISFINNKKRKHTDFSIYGVIDDESEKDTMWYDTITLHVIPDEDLSYYEAISFSDIKKLIKVKVSFLTKIKKLFE